MSLNQLTDILRRAPLFGGLIDCGPSIFRESAKEIASNLVWSLTPIWLGAIVLFAVGNNPTWTLGATFVSTVKHGELFMYSTATLAPVVYMALHDKHGAKTFPSKLTHMTLVMLITVVSAVFFGLERAEVEIRPNINFYLSLIFFTVSVILLFTATVYNNNRLEPSLEHRNQERSFIDSYKRHRGQ